ncbi:hypothetical protein LCGC14_1968800 [marine sediment metagenome]|uniref:Uncharacterized protein n=1 Tax=marine sediment metagenome TaxID=412755 RepID=A0A0F9FCE0_9ZZZZ
MLSRIGRALRAGWAAFRAEPGLLVVHPEQPVRTGPETETVTTATHGALDIALSSEKQRAVLTTFPPWRLMAHPLNCKDCGYPDYGVPHDCPGKAPPGFSWGFINAPPRDSQLTP